jgi:hypothetical protein
MAARAPRPRDDVGGCWPNREQSLLLRATLAEEGPARIAWNQWSRRVDLDLIDPASLRLLPLLFRRLDSWGVHHPWRPRLREIHRQTWARNKVILHRAAPLVTALQVANIPCVVLKGAALVTLYYRSVALRPMNDVDILVPTQHRDQARALLAAHGWTPTLDLPSSYLSLIHAMGYRKPGGGEVDLHWHLLWECCQPDADDGFWERAVSLRTANFNALALDPTDQLFHVCVHGLRWSAPPSLHWIADAITIMTSQGVVIDWDRFLEQASSRRLLLQASTALAFLREHFCAPIPPEVVDRLATTRRPFGEHLEFRLRQRPPALLRGLALHWFDHTRLAGHAGALRRLWGFPFYLQTAWGVRHVWQLPMIGLRKVATRVVANS